ncbi:ADM_HP2_G0040000.mRNA.1.CDS.1 [Saccharomyces cerevisiae]|nr:ADM_HP2_G0040000.mRNA.1.CDS.1 [Saccharomyces cerevisiae]CAI6569101.1 ADM_HP2_G0040000.mRNA.1.CDS.1 [Saccharomyces cerevisiae]
MGRGRLASGGNGNLVEDQLTDDQKAILEKRRWLGEDFCSNFNAVKILNWLRAGAAMTTGEHLNPYRL